MHEHHAIVPNSDRTAILVVGGRLPVVRTAERRHVATMAALREAYGVRSPILRVVRHVEDDDKRSTTLFEVDAARHGWTPPGLATWLALASLCVDEVEPLFPDGLQEWLSEQTGTPIPRERATAWVDEVAHVIGEPRLVRIWPISAIYAFDTSLGPLYLKACFSLWRHEPVVTAALARLHPGAAPEVVASTNPKAGCSCAS